MTLAYAVGICVVGQVVYHVTLRATSGQTLSPFVLVAAAYAVGILATLAVGVTSGDMSVGKPGLREYGVVLGVGVGVSLVELGYVFAYRNGLNVGTGAFTVLALTTAVLVPVAILVFREAPTLRGAVGLLCAVVGVWLISGR